MIDFNNRQTKQEATSDAFDKVLLASLADKRSKQERRTYVGASGIGDDCERRLQYEFAGAPREKEPEGLTLRKFDFGHMIEELARCWFQDAGFELVQQSQKTGKRFRFVQMGGDFSGEPDGVFLSGPAIDGLSYPAMWEHKAVGSKTFREIKKDGLKKARPKYWSQIHTCMAYLELRQTVFTVTNLDSGEQLNLIYDLESGEAQRMTDKAVRIIESTRAGEQLPRPYAKSDYFECKWCPFAKRCWADA
jgi:hypothetical protein